MKVGLILCDHVLPEYQEEFGDYPDMFAALFPEFEFVVYDATMQELPQDIQECDAYMGTGSKYSVYDDEPWITETLTFVKKLHEAEKCFVGVCFSHQLIGQALGGEVKKSQNGWCVGVQRFSPMGLNLLMMCQDQVVKLPPGAKVIAGNDMCENGIITIGRHILGIQAHPEFTAEYDRLLMENRVERMGRETVASGIKSLEIPVDRLKIKKFISEFIKNAIA